LFHKAGITIDIIDKQGFGTPYQSSVFDTPYSSFQIPTITSQTDLGALQSQFTTQVVNTITGAAGSVYGGTSFMSGTPISMGGGGGPCVYVQTANFYGANAKELGTAFLEWLKTGGDGMSSFRDVVCAAQA
jgi:hypothetical protein